MRFVAYILVIGLGYSFAGPARADFRCGTALVNAGDWPVEVEERCGKPDYVAAYPEAVLPGFGVVRTVEHWYYNRGPQNFIRRLVFRDGRLQREDSIGYGFSPAAAGACNTDALRRGVSEYEILARCGEPLSKRVTWQLPGQPGQPDALIYPVPVEEWLYEFNRLEFRRVATFRNGRLISVTIDDKPR